MGQSPFILAQHSVPSNCDPILSGKGLFQKECETRGANCQ